MSQVLLRRQLSHGKQKEQRQQVAAAMPTSTPSLRGAPQLSVSMETTHHSLLYPRVSRPVRTQA